MRALPKGLRILRVARETRSKPRSLRAGVTPARTASVYFLVSRATRKILSPFGEVRMYSLMPHKGLMPQRGNQQAYATA